MGLLQVVLKSRLKQMGSQMLSEWIHGVGWVNGGTEFQITVEWMKTKTDKCEEHANWQKRIAMYEQEDTN